LITLATKPNPANACCALHVQHATQVQAPLGGALKVFYPQNLNIREGLVPIADIML
jgi:hypothetical protein